MNECNPFRSDRAPLTNFVGHQVSKVVSACGATNDKLHDRRVDWEHQYRLHLLREQNHDFMKGNAAITLGLLVSALILNSA